MDDPERRSKAKVGGMKPSPQAPSANLQPTILVEHRGWHQIIKRASQLAQRAAIAAGGAGTIVLSHDLAVKRLNADHRNRNKPTNVLTFDAMHSPAGFLGGDIILALETVLREAAAAGRHPAHHMAHLVVHGALHLRGYDHHEAGDARRMEMEEARILHRIGVPNPWKRMAMANSQAAS
jgi:probable rRNA maturation factor